VALLTIAGLATLVINRPTGSPDLTTPGGVVTAYVQAIQAQDADRAWALIAPEAQNPAPGGFKRPFSRSEFDNEVRYGRRQTPSQIRITKVSQNGDTAKVQLEITDVSGGLFSSASSHPVSVDLRRQGASWLITSDPSPYQFQ